jgi:hypothetical protein
VNRNFLPALLLIFPVNTLGDNLTLFRGQGADTNFLEIIPDIVQGELTMDPTYFWGINYSEEIKINGLNPFTRLFQKFQITSEWEAQITKHSGLQDNTEVHLALLIRTRDFHPASLNINFAAGMGPSYALSRPTYEDGPDGQPNSGEYQFQSYMTFELELSLQSLPNWKIPIRIHHRSGIYGLVAPPKVGSNFFALGIRYSF